VFANETAELFDSFDAEETREVMRATLADLGPEETARQFKQAVEILAGYVQAAEEISVPLYIALSDAAQRASEAVRRAEAGTAQSSGWIE
jgi:hypothetical protein